MCKMLHFWGIRKKVFVCGGLVVPTSISHCPHLQIKYKITLILNKNPNLLLCTSNPMIWVWHEY